MSNITELAQREKFDAWWERTQNNGNPPRFGWAYWRESEGYKTDDDEFELKGMWEAWKAAGAEVGERAQKAALPVGLRLALSNAGIAAPESDEMLAAVQDKYIQDLVIWVRDRKPFQLAPVVSEYPETLPCPVILEPGFRFGKGVSTHLVLRALQNRAERYAELDAMGPEARAEHDAAIAELREKLGFGAPAKAAVQVKLPDLPKLGSDAAWYQGFAAGAGSMREACAAALISAGVEIIGEEK